MMMEKSSSQISAVNPVSKVSAVLATASIAEQAQALDARASAQAKQHAGLAAKMAVLHLTQPAKQATSTADVSTAAKLIDQSLQQAEAKGLTGKYIAQDVMTLTPKIPHLVSQQLKAAVSNTGLFYESHLRGFIDGQRQLSSIKLEPQNLQQQVAQHLLPQQLYILEHQRFSWHGEVWPNQKMDWDVYTKQENEETNTQEALDADTPIASDLTLHLPRLGKVTARVSIQSGRIRIGVLAKQKESLQLLKENSASLVDAIESNGPKLEGFTLGAFDQEISR